jgi:hypothetical protein
MKFIVPTTEKYSEVTLPVLIPSLVRSGVSPTDIVICYNSDREEYDVVDEQGIVHHYFDSHLYEYVALLGALRYDEDVFFLHDTCEVDDNFLELLTHFMEGKEFRSIRLKRGYSNNMGVYTHARLMEIKPRIKEFPKSIDKNTAIKWEDTFYGDGTLCFGGAPRVEGPIDVYGQSQPRRVEHYTAIGIKKYKSHWGQGIVGDKP